MSDHDGSPAGTSTSNNMNREGANEIGDSENVPSDINLFKEICGVDTETAVNLLRESGGNLEAAVHQFFYTRENPEVLQNQDNEIQELRRRTIVRNTQGAETVGQQLPLVRQTNRLTWMEWIRGIVLFPFRFLYLTATDLSLVFYNLFFGPSNRPPVSGTRHRAIQQQQQQNVIADRIIMHEQQTAYEQALAIDRQKAQQRKHQEEQRKEEQRRAKEETERLNDRKARLAERRKEVASSIPEEPEVTEENLVRIRISFPNGAKIERRFRQTDSLERLFEVVFINQDCPDDFSLFTNYPSTLLSCAPEWYKKEFPSDADDVKENDGPIKTFAQAGLLKTAIVMILDNEA